MEKEQTNRLSDAVTTLTRSKPMVNYRIMPGGITRIIDLHSSMYLVPIDKTNEFVLFDSGIDRQAKNLRQYLGHLGLGMRAIKEVYLTHAHSDHVGGVNEINSDSNAEIYVSEAEMSVLSGRKNSQGFVPALADKISNRHNAALPDVRPNFVGDYDLIKVSGDLAVRSFVMPGHTDGSLAYLVSNRADGSNSLIVGDSMDYDRTGQLKNAFKPVSHNTKQSLNSINRLVAIIDQDLGVRIDNVIPSHSGEGRWGSVRLFSFNS